jgi:hypothetical protein
MTKRMTLALVSCLALVACGGDDGPSNAAVGKTFTYVNSAPYAASSLDTSLAGTVAAGSASGAASTSVVGNADGLTAQVLGSSSIALATTPAQRNALAVGARAAVRQFLASTTGEFAYQFDDPACVSTTTASITMKGCTLTSSYTGTGYTETSKVQVEGALAYDASKGAFAWGFTVTDSTAMTYSGQNASGNLALHESGTLTVGATSIQGEMLAEVSVSARSPQASASLGMSEAVIIDLTYDATCSTRITGGTLEAKRVWTDSSGASAAGITDTSDKAAKITWTGCGQGKFQTSW